MATRTGRFLLGLVGMCLLASTSGCSGQTPAPAIFLGHIATLSGPDSKPGKSAEQGIRLALTDLGPAANEGLSGRPLVVRHVDAGGNLDNFEGQAARLVSINKAVALLGGLTRDEALRLDRSRVLVLTPIGLRTSGMGDLLFTTGLAPTFQGKALAQFLAEQSPAGGTLIVDSRRDEALAVADSFRRAWAEAFSKRDAEAPRWSELTLPKDVKHAEFAKSVSAEQPKAIVFAGAGTDFEALRQAWGSTAARLVFAGDDGFWSPQASIAGQTIHLATAFALGKDQTRALEFAKKYRAATGEDADVHAAVAHDNVLLLTEALKKAQPLTLDKLGEKLSEELLKIQDFPGLTGPLSFAPSRQLRRPAFIVAVDGASRAVTVVKKVDP
jgi:ABC-type branched-subunit amino acid transport system substrate-binding protein